METLTDTYQQIKEFLSFKLITIDGNTITLWTIISIIILIIILVIIVTQVSKLLEKRIFVKKKIDLGVGHGIVILFKYLSITIGIIIILSSSGINLSILTVLLGTLGVGIGFGLQSITSNFISGIIILFESHLKVGDRIEVGNTSGDVVKIATRATTILTNDNIAIIVPNSNFINKEVINWSYNDRLVRFKIPIRVAFTSDVRLVEKLLLEVAEENVNALKNPEPVIRFINFGDSGLNFELRVWTTSLIHRQGKITSELNFGIFEKFKTHNIMIPFPQMEVEIRNPK
jgi:small-conductance mechanosensitive channel